MKLVRIAAALAALAPLVPAQNARPSQRLDAGEYAFDPRVACGANVCVTAWVERASDLEHVFVRAADGRAHTFGPPIQLDQDPSGARKDLAETSVAVSGGRIYVLWADRRNSALGVGSELFLAISTDGGTTFGPETLLEDGVASGAGAIRDFALAVDQGVVYVLFALDPDGNSDEDLFLLVSGDGGASFAGPVRVSTAPAGSADVDALAVDARFNSAFVAWQDDRDGAGENDVFARALSVFLGSPPTVFFGVEHRVDEPGDRAVGELRVLYHENLRAVAWETERGGGFDELVLARVSTDGGASLGPESVLSDALADADAPELHVAAGDRLLCVWNDDRSGIDEVYARASVDGGATWGAGQQLSAGGGRFPSVAGFGDDVAVLFEDPVFGSGAVRGTHSTDGGVSFAPAVAVSDNAGDADAPRAAYEPTYRNYAACWPADDAGANNAYAGGFRPQTVTASGFLPGPTTVAFALTGFTAPGDQLGFVLGSLTRGPTPVAPGKLVDLGIDPLLQFFVNQPTLFLVPIVGGSASSGPFPATLAGGETFELAAVGLTFGVEVAFASLTDTVTVAVP